MSSLHRSPLTVPPLPDYNGGTAPDRGGHRDHGGGWPASQYHAYAALTGRTGGLAATKRTYHADVGRIADIVGNVVNCLTANRYDARGGKRKTSKHDRDGGTRTMPSRDPSGVEGDGGQEG